MKGRTLLIVLVLISISCGLFSICLFSLLAFVSVPIPLIFATLISGFSIAGAIASRLKQSTFTIERVLPLLVASIVFSTLSFFVLFRQSISFSEKLSHLIFDTQYGKP